MPASWRLRTIVLNSLITSDGCVTEAYRGSGAKNDSVL